MKCAKWLDFASIRIDDACRQDVIGKRGSSDSRYPWREARRAQDRRLSEGCVCTRVMQSQAASIHSNRDNDVLLEAV